ncbi:DUF3772 domain-containing protein [Aerosticca soli]|nr:DUF3772 domain-containing protein [Aerosticca soli]
MRLSFRLLLLFALSLLAGLPVPAQAQDAASTAPAPDRVLDTLQSQLDQVKAALGNHPADTALSDLAAAALAVQNQADALIVTLKPRLDSLQARLDVLGPAPAAGSPPEAAEVAAQRRQLGREKASVDAQIKQAQLIGEEAQQLAAQVAALRRDRFQAQLTARTASPFSHAFWSDAARVLPNDLARFGHLLGLIRDDLATAWQPPHRWPFLGGLGVALALLLGGRRVIEQALFVLARRLPQGRLRRSSRALGVALAYVSVLGLAAESVYLGLNWHDTLDPDLAGFARSVVQVLLFAAYVAGLGRALLSARHPSWRLIGLSDAAAARLRPVPRLLAIVVLILGIIERINAQIGASLVATVMARGLLALTISVLIALTLRRLAQTRRVLLAAGEYPARRPLWVGLLMAAAAVAVALVWLGLATGFIAFASFLATQLVWVGVVLGTLYLLTHLAHDLIEALLTPTSRSGKRLQATFGLAPATLDQAATVLSALIRILLCVVALTLVLAPYGAGPDALLDRVGQLFNGLKLGELVIRPGALLDASVVLALGWLGVRALKQWLGTQLLPKTSLDPGLRSSIVTLSGYVGGVLVVALTLAALQVSLQSITWIASALSVGIGFGLQAIVQNFISGLILLAERPVKVGDWVSLTGVEGDIRRINVRATEIKLWDGSTMIVPNSQFITQNVRNVTWGQAQGRVLIRLPMPLDTDADVVARIMLETMRNHPKVLAAPTCSVSLDGIEGGSLIFVAVAFVANPRDAGGVKSDLLFAILAKLRAEKLPLLRPQDMIIHQSPGATVPAASPSQVPPAGG